MAPLRKKIKNEDKGETKENYIRTGKKALKCDFCGAPPAANLFAG